MHSVDNYKGTTLAVGITASAVSMTVTADVFPSVLPFWLTLGGSGGEIVEVTAKNGTTFTVNRGCQNTIAIDHAAGSECELLCTAGQIEELQAAIPKTAIICDTQPSGTSGGTFTSGAWRTRTLNTIVSDNVGITLSNNQVTLPAGEYLIEADAPAIGVYSHKIRLQNITDATTTALGTSEYSASTDSISTRSQLLIYVTLSSPKVFEIQHRCSTTSANAAGLGAAGAFGVSEIYARVKIQKVG